MLGVLIYQLVLSPAFEKSHKNKELVSQLSALQNASTHITQLEKEIGKANQLLGNSAVEYENFQQELLSVVSEFCKSNKLVLRDFAEPLSEQKEEFTVETNKFEVSGKFQNLVKLVYLFDQKNRIGKVANVKFVRKKDVVNRTEYLSALIYIQNIKRNE